MSAVKHAANKYLSYDPPIRIADVLQSLADAAGDTVRGSHEQLGFIGELEETVRSLFGCEAALFLPSGKTAQNIALKIWCERRGFSRIAVHPRSHIEQWEDKAYAHVFGMSAVSFGNYDRQTVPADIDALPSHLGAACIEIALRPLGCPVVPWDDLVAMSQRLRAMGIPFHGDCARIWESQPFLGRSLPDIAALFDSLYVSLYKVVGGLAGSVLLGPASLIAEARIWRARLGQVLPGDYPFHLAALTGLRDRLPLVPGFVEKARSVARALSAIEEVRVTPDPPHTNTFQVILPGVPEKMAVARDEVARRTGLWLYHLAPANPIDGLVTFEVHIQSGGMQVEDREAVEAVSLFKTLIR